MPDSMIYRRLRAVDLDLLAARKRLEGLQEERRLLVGKVAVLKAAYMGVVSRAGEPGASPDAALDELQRTGFGREDIELAFAELLADSTLLVAAGRTFARQGRLSCV